MKKLYFLALVAFIFLPVQESFSQCVYYPVSMEQRVFNAKYIVLGKVTERHTYIDRSTGSVNTLNKLQVKAWLKNHSAVETVYIITLGGVYENMATLVEPSLQLDEHHEYILMLEDDNQQIDDKQFRSRNPGSLQLVAYADAQGALANTNNEYKDYFNKTPKTEQIIFEEIAALTKQVAKKPSGEKWQPRKPVDMTSHRPMAITSFSPTITRGGTIVPGDFITITGSGFGAAVGTVFFSNANDGGATFTTSGIVSDYNMAWSDNSITVKVPQNAGTGPINVNGTMTSASNLTVEYGHTAINSTFSGFGSSTRQRYYHRNMNGIGGYTYTYNNGFFSNAPAVAAFERALVTWRCNTMINWRTAQTGSAAGFVVDGINIVMFDGTLPVGVLGRATTQFSGGANGGCSLANTVWCATELDMQFMPDPPTAGFPWEYGPALPAFAEYDFESVVVHELGHHHGLQHRIAPGQVMNFALANGSSNRTPAAIELTAANDRMTYSTAATCFNPGTCGTGPMLALTPAICLTLPVNLTQFTGKRINATTNKLDWTTSQEQNSRGFYIQRSSDGNTFTDIGFVASAGNSLQTLNYTFHDNTAGPHAWYYKLRMVDIDGRQNFSSTIFIEGDQSTTWRVWADDKGDKIYLYGNTSLVNNGTLRVFASNGQQVISQSVRNGSNEIPVTFLSRGLYHYQLAYDGKVVSGKLFLGTR